MHVRIHHSHSFACRAVLLHSRWDFRHDKKYYAVAYRHNMYGYWYMIMYSTVHVDLEGSGSTSLLLLLLLLSFLIIFIDRQSPMVGGTFRVTPTEIEFVSPFFLSTFHLLLESR